MSKDIVKVPLFTFSEAVMRSTRCTTADVEKTCREWFRTASDRDGGRKKRSEKRTQQQPAQRE